MRGRAIQVDEVDEVGPLARAGGRVKWRRGKGSGQRRPRLRAGDCPLGFESRGRWGYAPTVADQYREQGN